jgi:hypothetical protein
MNMPLRSALAIALLAAAAAPATAGDVKLSIANGRVTLIARDATVREILAEWARVGQTRIVNGEKLAGPPVTIELTDVPEAQALDTVLRSAAGYVMAPRSAGSTGSSVYDRILILASSRPPAVTASAPAPFPNRQVLPAPQNTQPDDGVEFAPPVNPAFINGNQIMPGMMAQPQQQMPQQMPQPQAPMTAPRPGPLPAPPAGPNNGFNNGVNNGLNNGINNGPNNGINNNPNAVPNPYLGMPPGPPVPGFNPNPPPPQPRGPGGNRGGQ